MSERYGLQRILSITILVTTACFLFSLPCMSQEFRAEIQGTVWDQSGSRVPGAEIRLYSEATGISTSTTSDSMGEYRLLKLMPGRYRMEASMPGFKTFVRPGIELEVAAKVRLDLRLEIGEVQERVEVIEVTPMVNAVDASIDQTVREREITDLPINGRNAYSLLGLSAEIQPANPGIYAETMPRQIGLRTNFSLSGTPQRTNEVLLDGVPNTAGKLIIYTPSPDVVQEFKVQNSFDAEYGYLLGGIVNAVTKSGSNSLHGSVWEFLRNDVLQANDFFSNRYGLDKAPFRFNQFGFAAGGPILKNKAFFFGSYEGIRERSPSTYVGTLPTEKQRAGDFSETFAANGKLIEIYDPFSTRASGSGFVRDAFTGNRIPASLMDPVGKALIGYYPLPNQPGDPVTGANNYATSGAAQENYDSYQLRIDYQLTPKQKLFGRYSRAHPISVPFNPYNNEAIPDWTRDMVNPSFSLDYTYAHSATLLFDVRVGAARHWNDAGPYRGFDATRLNLPAAYVSQLQSHYFPRVNVSDSQQLGPPSGGQLIADNGYSLHGNVNKVRGRHNLKIGIDVRFNQGNQFVFGHSGGQFSFARGFTQGPNPLKSSVNAGHGVASMLLGTGSGNTDIQEPLSMGISSTALYFNDSFNLSRNLSVNLGLRYENYGPLSERFDRFARGFDWQAASPIEAQALANYATAPIPEVPVLSAKGGLLYAGVGGVPRGLTDRDNNNFAPRIGLAYSITRKSVLRAGYGISYSQLDSIIPRNIVVGEQVGFSESTPWTGSIDGITPYNLARDPYPDGLIQPAGSSLGLLAGVGRGVQVVDVRPRTPYIQSYQASLQQELASDLLAEVAYIGNTLQRTMINTQLNALPAQYLTLGSRLNQKVSNPFYGLITSGSIAAKTTTVQQLLLPYPHFTGLTLREMFGRSWYHSMRLKVEKRFSNDLSFLISYRVSKLMERTGYLNSSDPGPAKVLAGTDSPQRFVASGLWELPFGAGKSFGAGFGNGFAQKLIGGWQLNWILTLGSGFPVGAPGGAVNTGGSAELDDPTIDRWFKTEVFEVQPPFTLRTLSARLPDVRTDTYKNLDLSLIKNTHVTERVRIQFRAEFFNAFNTPLFGGPNTNIRRATFGQVTGQANGPREIQFGLKVLF